MPHPLTPEQQSTSQKFSDRIWWAVTPIDGPLSTRRLTNDNQYPTATWDPPSHSQLVPHLPLPSCSCRFQPASLPALADPEWGVSCLACSASRARKIRQPTPQGLSLSLKATIQLIHGRPPICKHMHLQSFWCWDSLSAEIKRHMNSRIRKMSWGILGKILKSETPVINYFSFLQRNETKL